MGFFLLILLLFVVETDDDKEEEEEEGSIKNRICMNKSNLDCMYDGCFHVLD